MTKYRASFIDPTKIPEADLPLICLADDRRGLLGFFIKSHTSGNYNHVQEMHEVGQFATQDPVGYREVPLERYLKPFMLLKFWKVKNLTEAQRKFWLEIIRLDLDAPWKDRRYDWIGIFGQILKIPWLNNPHLKYCSERVADHLRKSKIKDLPEHPTPSALNMIFNLNEIFEVYGYWIQD